MKTADLIIQNAGQLVTCASPGRPKRGPAMQDAGIIENGAVAIAGGKFVGVGSTAEILRAFTAEKNIDAAGTVVCPGFEIGRAHV